MILFCMNFRAMKIFKDKHIKFIRQTLQKKDLNFYFTEPTRLSTMYWTLNSYKILKMDDLIESKKKDVKEFVLSCRNQDGGFGGNKGYPSTVLSTFNALQIFYILKETYNCPETFSFILDLVNDEGIFNDKYGKTDVRIVCSGVLSLHLLHLLSKNDFTKESLEGAFSLKNELSLKHKISNYIMSCYNRDGGFGSVPGGESHNAFTFCCLSTLRTLGIPFGISDIARFIVLRQKENGGISGRVGKKEDVCYSFWAYASMILIGRKKMINENKLKEFIFSCQNKEGGFSDRPGNEPDIYHLMFSLAALGLLGYDGLYVVDPGFCL